MDDLISRKAVLEATSTTLKITGKENAKTVYEYIKKLCDDIKALPSAQHRPYCYLDSPCPYQTEDIKVTDENKWIKCSERLPEKEGEYLTTIGKSHPVVRALFYGDPFAFPKPTEWFFYCEHGYGIDRFKAGTEVIAWMPLPDPIEEENDG